MSDGVYVNGWLHGLSNSPCDDSRPEWRRGWQDGQKVRENAGQSTGGETYSEVDQLPHRIVQSTKV